MAPHAAHRAGRSRFVRGLAYAMVFAVASTTGCALNAVTGSPEITLSSSAREHALGSDAARSIEEYMGLVEDRALVGYVEEIGARLVAALPSTNTSYTFKVLDSDVPNALALPGGFVYVTRGLLAYLNSEDELACVMGHEIGHVAAQHSLHQRTRSILTSPFTLATGIAGAATGILAPRIGGLITGVGQVATGAVLAGYSREQEREADRLGMGLAAKSGWSPAGMSAMLDTLSRSEKLSTGHVHQAGFLDTHPSTPERAEASTKHARSLSVAQTPTASLDQPSFYRRLEGLLVGENPRDGVFDDNRFLHADLDFVIVFPDGWGLQNSRGAVAGVDPTGKAALFMQLLGKGDDPLIAASTRRKALGFTLDDVSRRIVNGLPATRVARLVPSGDGLTAIHVTWIVHHDLVFEIFGVANPDVYLEFLPNFEAGARSFNALTAADRERIKATRLTVATAARGESLRDVLDRIGSTWSPAKAAVANGLADEKTRIPEGRAVKAPITTTYVVHK